MYKPHLYSLNPNDLIYIYIYVRATITLSSREMESSLTCWPVYWAEMTWKQRWPGNLTGLSKYNRGIICQQDIDLSCLKRPQSLAAHSDWNDWVTAVSVVLDWTASGLYWRHTAGAQELSCSTVVQLFIERWLRLHRVLWSQAVGFPTCRSDTKQKRG